MASWTRRSPSARYAAVRRRRRSSASAQCIPATMLALCSCPVASAVLVQCYVCVFALLSVL